MGVRGMKQEISLSNGGHISCFLFLASYLLLLTQLSLLYIKKKKYNVINKV